MSTRIFSRTRASELSGRSGVKVQQRIWDPFRRALAIVVKVIVEVPQTLVFPERLHKIRDMLKSNELTPVELKLVIHATGR